MDFSNYLLGPTGFTKWISNHTHLLGLDIYPIIFKRQYLVIYALIPMPVKLINVTKNWCRGWVSDDMCHIILGIFIKITLGYSPSLYWCLVARAIPMVGLICFIKLCQEHFIDLTAEPSNNINKTYQPKRSVCFRVYFIYVEYILPNRIIHMHWHLKQSCF